MRSRWSRAVAFVAATAAVALVASCATQADNQQRSAADAGAQAQANGCDPQFPDSSYSNTQYYSLFFQIRSCELHDMPLSLDTSADPANAKSFSSGVGSGLTGPAVVWNAGDGSTQTGPSATIPKGSGSGYGALVGFMTLPAWDGYNPAPYGPCASSIQPDLGQAQLNPSNQCMATGSSDPKAKLVDVNDFSGSWAIYLPTATITADVVNSIPFPYVPSYDESADPKQSPGALATGLTVLRTMPGRGSLPLFDKGSTPYSEGPPSYSPPSDSFIPSACLDNVVVKNGENTDPYDTTDWSTKLAPPDSPDWDVTVATDLGGELPQNALFLTTGWINTFAGEFSKIQLGDPVNQEIAQRPHYFKLYLHEFDGAKCNGTTKRIPASVVGGTGNKFDVSGATLLGPLLVNSSFTSPNFTGTIFSASGGDPSLAFTRLTTQGTPVAMARAQLDDANLTGTAFGKTDMTGATLKGAKLFYADLSQVTGSPNLVDVQTCQTILPGQSKPTNNNCSALPSRKSWGDVTLSDCKPSQCAFTSIYNNTTRTLTKGLTRCDAGSSPGKFAAPQVINPLDTAQFGWTAATKAGSKGRLNCMITYSNGPWGKIRVLASNLSGQLKITVDSGACAAADASACLPKAAPAKLPHADESTDSALWPPARPSGDPIKISSATHEDSAARVTKFDVILCEPEAYTTPEGSSQPECSAKPKLPGY